MNTITPVAEITPEELLTLRDSVRYELVEGQLVERRMGTESSEIALRIAFLITLFLRAHPLGRLFGSDASYQCFPDRPKKVRRADVGFITFDRLPKGRAPKGHCRAAPDLAVEVISPRDIAEEIEAKIAEYLSAGVKLVWVVSPAMRSVRIYRPHDSPAGSISLLMENDAIGGEEVLPGFSCRVSEFFENA